MSLKLYRPAPGGLEPSPVQDPNWRRRLRSRRWGAAPLANPEAPPTSAKGVALLFVGLAILTFVLLLIGYGTGFWA
ncbi:hypothetical protein BH20CHL6_BH20CHL6_12330 [soil metagenome]